MIFLLAILSIVLGTFKFISIRTLKDTFSYEEPGVKEGVIYLLVLDSAVQIFTGILLLW